MTGAGAPQEIIDVHLHCFASVGQAAELGRGLERLRREGVRHLAVMGLVNTHLDERAIWNLMPSYVENRGDALFNEASDLLDLARLQGPMLVPLVDARHLWGPVSSVLGQYMDRGFRGLKSVYLPDNDNDLGVGNVPDTFGISLEQYHRREWEIFDFARRHDLPLVYHMDARRYGDVMLRLLEDFPEVRVCFPHLGISRRSLAKILDRYPGVYTDLAAMAPHVRANPESYRDFILHYPERICFGSDAFLYTPARVLDHIHMVRELNLPPEIETRIFSTNPRAFLGRALMI